MMVVIILKTNHVVNTGLSGTMVECHVFIGLTKLFSNINGKIVEVGVLGIHMFMNQSEALLLGNFKSTTPT